MIIHLAETARRCNIFASFVVCTNDRNLTAYDYSDGCNWDDSIVPTLVTSLTNEAIDLLEEKKRKRTTCHRKEETIYEHSFVDPLFEVCLCLLEGRYVTHSGWFISLVITVLAYLGEAGKTKPISSSTIGANDNANSATSSRTPKAVFFALHMGYYLVTVIFSGGRDFIATLGAVVPVPWQLQLVGVAATIPCFTEWNHRPLLHYIVRTSIETKSALAVGFDWILSRNAKVLVPHSKFSNSRFVRYIQTIADFGVLSIPFLVVQLLCSAFYP